MPLRAARGDRAGREGAAFERRDVDLTHKPAWFRAASPLGKTPVLLVGGEPIFESAVICEYLDDTLLPRLHPADALKRARHRAWMEFGSALLNSIAAFYNAADDTALAARASEIRGRFEQLEAVPSDGPYFAGTDFSIVDAVFGPVFRYFELFDELGDFGFWQGLHRVPCWRAALAARPSVASAVRADYRQLLRSFVQRRGGALPRMC